MKTAPLAAVLTLALAACASSPPSEEGPPPAQTDAPPEQAPAPTKTPDKTPAPDKAPAPAPATSDEPGDPSEPSRSSLAEPLPPSKNQNGPPLPRSMLFEAKKKTDRGLELMELAFKEKRRQRRIELFDLAIDRFKKANLLYYQRLEAPGAQVQVINNQIARIEKFLNQCYSARPLADE